MAQHLGVRSTDDLVDILYAREAGAWAYPHAEADHDVAEELYIRLSLDNNDDLVSALLVRAQRPFRELVGISSCTNDRSSTEALRWV